MGMLSEQNAVEAKVCEWLSKMGWQYRSSDDLKQYNRPFANPIIEPILLQQIQRINNLTESDARMVMEQLTQHLNNPGYMQGNELFLDRLVNGVTVTIQGEDRDCFYIDFDNVWDNNDFIVTRQYWTKGEKMLKSDCMLLVNGIPLVPIEAKQRARKGTNWIEGVKQFSTYHIRAAKLFICHAFGVACNGRIMKAGIPGVTAAYFNEWKDTTIDVSCDNPLLKLSNGVCGVKETEGIKHLDIDPVERMKTGIVGMLQPARVLDLIRNFIVFERSQEHGIVKKVARYQQLRAANKIVERVVASDLDKGVIWHTQGSGKSLTMLFTAYKLRNAEQLDDPTVYIVVDRKDLKEQIGGTFDDCEFPNTAVPTNIGQLKAKIKDKPAEVIITTVQKFQDLGDVKDDRHNVIVLIDEAHRTQYGDFQSELMAVLPNAKRFAFTGTPIPKTHKVFSPKDGKEVEFYLDQYSIKDAIEDGATVKIRYTFGPQEWFLNKDQLKEGWENITAELSEDEKRSVERRTQAWKVFLKHPERIAALSKDIADDFRNVVDPLGFKAQVVGCDKEACVLYYNELTKYFDASEIAIVFSKGNYDDAERYELYKDHYLEDGARKKLISNFKKKLTEEEKRKGNNVKILIVCNMLLTGFDAPIEQTMYLDSPLRDHNLLQAIARTNRPYDDVISQMAKQFGRVVDYVGLFKNYQEALNYDPKDIGEFEDVESLVNEFPAFLDDAMAPFDGIKLEDSYECSIAIVRVLSSLDHGEYEQKTRGVIQLYEAISPHPKLLGYRAKYQWMIEIYEIYMEEFKRCQFDAEFYAAKTRKMIQENSKLLNFKGHLPEIEINERYLDKLASSKLEPTDKAEKIIRDIETVIRENESESPVYSEFQNRLDELIKKKESEAQGIEKILKELSGLFGELEDIANLPHRMGFDDRGSFDVFMEIKNKKGSDFDENLAKTFAKDITERIKNRIYVGWQDHGTEVKKIKNDIEVIALDDTYEALGVGDDEELLEAIMKRILQHYSLE